MDSASITAGLAAAVETAGKIDILVNNGHQATKKTWHDVSADEFTEQLANATGYFLLAKAIRDHSCRSQRAGERDPVGVDVRSRPARIPIFYEGIGPSNPVAYQALKAASSKCPASRRSLGWRPDTS